jgi:hypothetical protein
MANNKVFLFEIFRILASYKLYTKLIKASTILHYEKKRIKVEFPYNNIFIAKLKQIDDAHWSKTHNAWHIPNTKISFEKLKELFPEIEYPIQKEEINNEEQIQTDERSGNKIDFFQHLLQKNHSAPRRNLFTGVAYIKFHSCFYSNATH